MQCNIITYQLVILNNINIKNIKTWQISVCLSTKKIQKGNLKGTLKTNGTMLNKGRSWITQITDFLFIWDRYFLKPPVLEVILSPADSPGKSIFLIRRVLIPEIRLGSCVLDANQCTAGQEYKSQADKLFWNGIYITLAVGQSRASFKDADARGGEMYFSTPIS